MNRGMRVWGLAVMLGSLAIGGAAEAGDLVVTKWKATTKKCSGAKGATVTIAYVGDGSKLIQNRCFRAVFEDGTTCDGSSGDFADLRITQAGGEMTRAVCFRESRYAIRQVVYHCQDAF